MSSDLQLAIKSLIDALEDFLHSGADSEGCNAGDPFDGEDSKELAIESVEPGGEIHNAVSAVQPFYRGNLPAPEARNPWMQLKRVCLYEADLFKRQIEAHLHAKNLQDWAEAEKAKLKCLPPVCDVLDGDEPHADVTGAVNGAAPRNTKFLEWYEAEGTETYHKPAMIYQKWKNMTVEKRAEICPGYTNYIAKATVEQSIKRARIKRDGKPTEKPNKKRTRGR